MIDPVETGSAILPNFGKYCSRRRLLHPEDVEITIARNVGNYVFLSLLVRDDEMSADFTSRRGVTSRKA